MSSRFNFVPETTWTFVDIGQEAEKKDVGRPFVCFLDLWLYRSTRGARVFAAMKGAVDWWIHIPHNDKIFPKNKDQKEWGKDKGKEKGGEKAKEGKGATASTNPLRDRLFWLHVQKYMDELSKKPEAFKRQFSKWDKCLKDNKVTKLEDLYKKVFSEIRKNPTKAPTKKKVQKPITRDTKDKNVCTNWAKKYRRDKKITNKERKQRVDEKIKKWVEERKKATNTTKTTWKK